MKGLLALVLGSAALAGTALVGTPASQAQASDHVFEHSLSAPSVATPKNPLYAQADPFQFVVVINGTNDVVTYEVDGQKFQLAKGQRQSHRVISYISPQLKFDLFNSADQQNMQTQNLLPGISYTFISTFNGQIALI
jgi:hypothetical protein